MCIPFLTLRKRIVRSSHPKVLLAKGVLKIWSKFTGEHPCQSTISIKLKSNFIEIALRHGCSSVNLLHIFRTPFLWKTSGWLLLDCWIPLFTLAADFDYWRNFYPIYHALNEILVEGARVLWIKNTISWKNTISSVVSAGFFSEAWWNQIS